jgi:lipopolysaccharide transport system permease protein
VAELTDAVLDPAFASAPRVDAPAREVLDIQPRRGLLDLDLRSVWRFRELLTFLVWRELKVRYKQAALGAAWAIIQPLFAVLIFTAVFGVFARIPSDRVPYPLFAFAALLPWTYFSEATRRASIGLVGESDLVRKIYFPRLIIPLAMVVAPLIDFGISFVILLAMMAFYGFWPTWHVLAVLPLLSLSLMLALAFSLWLGPINVRFRDIMQTIPFVLQIWMYATPIVYPLDMVPDKWRTLYSLNPMVGVVEGFRWALLDKGDVDTRAIAISLVFISAALAGGLVFFRRMERSFADII